MKIPMPLGQAGKSNQLRSQGFSLALPTFKGKALGTSLQSNYKILPFAIEFSKL